jgi:phosphoribosylamine---glycine ligase
LRVLIVGSGGREHALAFALARDGEVSAVYAAPGNPGITSHGDLVPIEANDIHGLADFARKNRIDLSVIGPEVPLSLGIVDAFQQLGLTVFGPSRAAARTEFSKAFTKSLCTQYGIPTARWGRFDRHEEAIKGLDQFEAPWVIKADGLAGGKGVTVSDDRAVAEKAIGWALSRPPGIIVIEEYIDGWEATIIATIAGDRVCWIAPIFQDSKRLSDDDRGPHTGGMGPFTPVPLATPSFIANSVELILKPFARALVEQGAPYFGVISPNVITKYGTDLPYLMECNARFGDPEMQCLAPFIHSGLAQHMQSIACRAQEIEPPSLNIREDYSAAVAVVVASADYPERNSTGVPIRLRPPLIDRAFIFHAGTARNVDGTLVTSGGRILNVVGAGASLEAARAAAYKTIEECVDFEGMKYRRDIGMLGATRRRPFLFRRN